MLASGKSSWLFMARVSCLLVLGAYIFSPATMFAQSDSNAVFLNARPSVVRLVMQINGKVRAPGIKLSESEDGIPYIVRDETIQIESPVSTSWLCSGFVVNPSGYILTNAHCADVSTENVNNAIWEQYSYNLLGDLESGYPNLSKTNQGEAFLQDLQKQILDFISQNGVIDSQTYWLSVLDPNKGEGNIFDLGTAGLQVDIKKEGEPYPKPGKDVAILKIQKDNMIPLKLGDAGAVKQGDRVYVIGYPGIADLNDSSNLEPTLTSGIVSAVKKSSEGDYSVIQIDATVSGGNSGGPVLNEAGEVVGIATFGISGADGYNWILPIDLGKEFMHETNVDNSIGDLAPHYKNGVSLFLGKHYKASLKELEAVQSVFPNVGTAGLITKANEAVLKGEDVSVFLGISFDTNDKKTMVITYVLGGLILICLIFLGWRFFRKKSSIAPVVPTMPAQPSYPINTGNQPGNQSNQFSQSNQQSSQSVNVPNITPPSEPLPPVSPPVQPRPETNFTPPTQSPPPPQSQPPPIA